MRSRRGYLRRWAPARRCSRRRSRGLFCPWFEGPLEPADGETRPGHIGCRMAWSLDDTRCVPSRWFLPATAVSLRGCRHLFPVRATLNDNRIAPSSTAPRKRKLPSTVAAPHVCPTKPRAILDRAKLALLLSGHVSFARLYRAEHACMPRRVSDERETIFCRPPRQHLRFKRKPKATAPPRRQRSPVYPMAGRRTCATGE